MHSPRAWIICEATSTFFSLLPAFSWRRETIQCGWAKNLITQLVQISAVLPAQDASHLRVFAQSLGRRANSRAEVAVWNLEKDLDTGWAIQSCKCSAWGLVGICGYREREGGGRKVISGRVVSVLLHQWVLRKAVRSIVERWSEISFWFVRI